MQDQPKSASLKSSLKTFYLWENESVVENDKYIEYWDILY